MQTSVKRSFVTAVFLFVTVLVSSCSGDDMPEPDTNIPGQPDDEEIVDDGVTGNDIGVLINKQALKDNGYVLVNDPGNNRVYIMEKEEGGVLYEWTLPYHLGNDAKLLEDARLLVSMRAEDPVFQFGGYGGKLQLLDENNTTLWNYDLSTEDLIAHHDVIMLPNGNVLTMLWEKTDAATATALGYNGAQPEIYTETLVEIDPGTNEIVWRWDSRDHLVQDANTELDNYGNVGEMVRRIHINYRDDAIGSIPDNGDLMHANGITYDASTDLIYMSVNYYSEVWVIDHSTTTVEAAGATGGNFGVGGDLVYRFGNPEAYSNAAGDRMFYNNHTPRLLTGTDHVLIYMNGNHTEGPSVVYELDLPDDLALEAGFNNEPRVVWEYSHPDMYSAKVSGAERLSNGNTLIAIGTFGYWEVTPEKDIVWQYREAGFFWRGYPLEKNAPALDILGVQ